ncbi:L,D-transpeptidase family protein [Paucisalibacillus globulus]|uniref:L,D-transpeptidase family protein n=1 Tax=Paucisalibacillus globulus TaxID=351095 RepID=UPI0004014703|nr:L,D-transpeptidase family protein [Paucisalibacillus globulus]
MSNEEFTEGLDSRSERHQKRKRRRFLNNITIIILTVCLFILSIFYLKPEIISLGNDTLSERAESQVGKGTSKPILELKDTAEDNGTPVVEKMKAEPPKEKKEGEKEVTKSEQIDEKSDEAQINPKKVMEHVVQQNETLFEIAILYFNDSSKQDTIAEYNGIVQPEKEVQVGKVIMIPDPHFMIQHQVSKGETLQQISNYYYGTIEYANALAMYNDWSDANHVPYGTSIHIPNPSMLQKGLALPVEEEEVQEEEEVIQQDIVSGNGTYLIKVDKQNNQLHVYHGDKSIKTFSVSTGRDTAITPTGTFQIVNQLEKPWYSKDGIPGGDPNNPLGNYWLGLNVPGTNGTTYGIHGTNDPSSIGYYVTLGCVRMKNEDVQWIFETVPVGTEVQIY